LWLFNRLATGERQSFGLAMHNYSVMQRDVYATFIVVAQTYTSKHEDEKSAMGGAVTRSGEIKMF
jgi:hypothetical protein